MSEDLQDKLVDSLKAIGLLLVSNVMATILHFGVESMLFTIAMMEIYQLKRKVKE